jgi:rod shape-determining protein MreD
MNIQLLKGVFAFAIILLVQVMVLNHIHLFNCATPLLYIYMVLLFPRNYPRWAELLLCFVMGLLVDTFSDTPGVSMAAMTFMGLIQPSVLNMFLQRDSADDLAPSMRSMGLSRFGYYAITMILVYCVTFFTLETFNFFNWLQWIECVGGSTVITALLVLAIENYHSK